MKHFVCFCGGTGSSPNTSLLSDQKGPVIYSSGPSVTQRGVCWEIIWRLASDTSKAAEWGEKRGGKKKKKRRREEKEERAMGLKKKRRRRSERPRGVEEWEREDADHRDGPYHVTACQLAFKNGAFERPSRAVARSMLWKCLLRRNKTSPITSASVSPWRWRPPKSAVGRAGPYRDHGSVSHIAPQRWINQQGWKVLKKKKLKKKKKQQRRR